MREFVRDCLLKCVCKNSKDAHMGVWEKYRKRTIVSRGLYIFYPISKDYFFIFKEVFSENFVLFYGSYSREAYDGARTVVNDKRFVSAN